MQYTQIKVPHLSRLYGAFDVTMLEKLTQVAHDLVNELGRILGRGELTWEDMDIDDQMASVNYPQYKTIRQRALVNQEVFASILADYCYANPRDGESWALQITVMKDKHDFIHLSTRDNVTEPEFTLGAETRPEYWTEIVRSALQTIH